MKYQVIEDVTTEALSIRVNELIENGWLPLGGVSCSLSESDEYQYYSACQAMTYTDSDSPA